MENAIDINPNVLIWCREQAGLTIERTAELAKFSALKETKNQPALSPAQRLYKIEQGEVAPTLEQLRSLSKVYQRPLMTFFLDNPPIIVNKLVDFRTIDSIPHDKDSPEFARLKRRLFNLQEVLSGIEKESKSESLDFIGTVNTRTDINDFIKLVRTKINFSYDEQRQVKNEEDLFRVLREKIQESGVYVVLEGDLGSYHSLIDTSEFRGIAIADKFAPLIVINPNDYKQAILFTLLHEFAHIWLGDNSISNSSVLTQYDNEKEIFCNKFAAEFLLPQKEVATIFINEYDEFNSIVQYAKTFKVSLMVMARRLLDLGKITNYVYTDVIKRIKKSIEARKEKQKLSQNAIVNRNTMDRYRLGSKVISTVMNATYSGKISMSDASILLNVSNSRFDRIL